MTKIREEQFAQLLTEAVHRIRFREAKTIQIVQDELGYALGRDGGSMIEYWRKGHVPPKMADIEILAREIVQRGAMNRVWLETFLQSAHYPHVTSFCDTLFPSSFEVPGSVVTPEQATLQPSQRQVRDASGLLTEAIAPFIIGPPVIHPRNFFGRVYELKRIFDPWQNYPLQNVAIIGARRSGKTSLLHYVKRITTVAPTDIRPGQRVDWLSGAERYQWVLVDFQDARLCHQEPLSGVLLALVRIPGDVLLISLLFTIVNSLALGILLGLAVGVAVGTVGGLVSGGMNGIIIAIAIANAGPAVELDTISLLTAVGNNLTLTALFAGLNNVAIGVTASFLFTVTNDRTDYIAPRKSLEIGAVVLGFVTNVFTLGLAFLTAIAIAGGVLFDLTYIVVYSLAIGGAVGLRTQRWRRCVAAGMGAGLLRTIDSLVGQSIGSNGLPGALAGLTMSAVTTGLLYASFLALPHAIATRIAGTRAGAIAGVIGISGISLAENYLVVAAAGTQHTFLSVIAPITLLGMLIGVTQAWWRPLLLYPFCAAWNLVLYQIDRRRAHVQSSCLRWHSAFWDEHQWLPLIGLDEYLVFVAERNPPAGRMAMDELATTTQRWAVQRAQIELDARLLERCDDVYALAQSHRTLAAGDLTGPASALLRSFSRISQDVQAAVSQTSESAYSQRLALSAVEDRLDGLLRELVRSNEPYALRFRSIAMQWRTIIAAHVRALVEAVEQRQEIDSPYVIAVPLTEQQDIFVGRTDVSHRIERLVLDQLHPPLLLYGQRRMGKTSLLNNLGRLLPSTFLPLFVDLMGPVSLANDHAGFLYGIARAMIASADQRRNIILPPLDYQTLIDNPFIRFDEWLDAVEQVMRSYGRETVLLLLDEFEVLEQVLTEGRLSEMAVLGTLRHLIQHRTHFKVILAGSHTMDEIRHFASYLINVQLIHIGYLNEAEARQLIKHPVKDFALRYTPDAVQRVLDLTRCHPFLVQLLCREIVAVKNLQPPTIRRLAHPEDVEQAIPQALSTGRLFFEDIEVNQVDGVSRAALRFVARQGEGTTVSQTVLQHHFPDMLEQTLALLTRRELLEPHNGGYRFQVELIRRWFAGANQRVVERLGGDQ